MAEFRCLHQHLDMYRVLVEKSADVEPDPIERSALGAMLHGFYTGVETIFKRVAKEIEEEFHGGEEWHRSLLNRMAQPGSRRPRVISAELHARLREYLEFRHVFRQGYGYILRWDKMSALVAGCEETLRRVEAELEAFFQTLAESDPDKGGTGER